MPSQTNGLDDFMVFLRQYANLIAAGFGSAAVLLITQLTSVAPPWPSAAIQLTAIAQLFVLMFVAQLMSGWKRRRVSRAMKVGALFAVVFALSYFGILSMVEYEDPGGDRQLRGLICTQAAAATYSDCPFLARGLVDSGYQPSEIWTSFGLALSRTLVLVLWTCFICCTSFVLAAFAYFQRSEKIEEA